MTQTENTDYKDKIADLLSNYEDGYDVFKKAQQARNWDYPLVKKPGALTRPGLPDTWLELVEKVIGIYARDKYGLDCFDNTIEIITSGQMLDAYASVGMPLSYEHWSFGKQRIAEEKLYKQGKQGLAYEIVINTDPAIAYCMENNTPLMQMLVIAHASFGHNSFFKGNHLFRQFTAPATIIDDLRHMRDFIRDCEDKHGYREVEKLLDACHALQTHAVYRTARPEARSAKDLKEIADRKTQERFSSVPDSDIYDKIRAKNNFNAAHNDRRPDYVIEPDENLLLYMADNAPHLEPWQRQIMRMVADKSQYFYPQRQTQVMNEGWASFWHYTLLNDLREDGLIDNGMMLEFIDSHNGVLFQPEFDSPYFSGRMNPYALGFAIFQDIKRICTEPTDEDRKCFPDIAGNGDWLGTLKEAMANFKDESFIEQYLSPKVIRDFNLFALKDDAAKDFLEISAIQDSEGYENVRHALASNYRLADNEPRIEAAEFHNRTDRRLVLRHTIQNDRPIEEKDMREVLKHMYQIWQHPVVLQNVTVDGAVKSEMSCPPNYKPSQNGPVYRP